MKNVLFFSLILLLFSACQNEEADVAAEDAPVAAPAEQQQPKAADPAEFGPKDQRQTIAKNSPVVGQPGARVSPQTQTFIDFATTDYWEMYAYLRMAAEPDVRRQLNADNRGRWFKFAKDGSYISGRWQEETGKGRWFYDPMGPLMYLKHDDRRDEEWTVKMNSDGTVMIWIGTKTFDETGVQVKMENTTDLPQEIF